MSEALTYEEREQRKRTIHSYIIAIAIYALLLGVGILFDILRPESIDFSNKSLIVNIQGPVTNDIGKGSPIQKEESLVAEKPAPPPVHTQPGVPRFPTDPRSVPGTASKLGGP